jgi:sigma-B regulation protein RsbU (phosphoserine phosphatase)
LEAAASVQQAMLPKGNIVTPQVCTAWKYVPSEELAGDAIGLHLIDGRYLVAYVIDVSGHGVPAALLSVSAMHAMDPQAGAASVLRDLTGAGGMGTVQRPALVAAEMNRRFRAGDNGGRYLTMILAALDTQSGRLRFTSAGHPPLIVLRGAHVVPVAEAGGYPIAWFEEGEYQEAEMQLEAGDRVFLYSDGLEEQVEKGDGEQFGEERLLALLQAQARVPVEGVVGRVVEALSEWAGVTAFADDVSMAAVEWKG